MSRRDVTPERILRELDDLWVSLGAGEGTSETEPVLRACAMTLVVITAHPSDDLGETLALVMRDHPARAIVVHLVDDISAGLEARVLAQCWTPFGRRQQICSEQVEVVAGRWAREAVVTLIRGLLVPDLPLAVWCRQAPLLDYPALGAVFSLAGKLIVDSSGEADLPAQVARLERARRTARFVADLAWTGLTPCRRALAQAVEGLLLEGRLAAIEGARIDYRGGHLPMAACYLAAWLEHCTGRKLAVEFGRLSPAEPATIASVTLPGAGPDFPIEISGRPAFPPLSAYDLLREELSLWGPDPVYDAVSRIVSDCAGAVRTL